MRAMTYDETVATQPQRMRITEMVIKRLTEGEDPDCVIIFSGSPLAKAGVTHLACPNGDIELIPDPCCPPGYEYVGLKDELAPKSKDPAPATKHGPAIQTDADVEEALNQFGLSPAVRKLIEDDEKAPKPSHEERARAWLYEEGYRGAGLASITPSLASAFAEVEAEAKLCQSCLDPLWCPKADCEPEEAGLKLALPSIDWKAAVNPSGMAWQPLVAEERAKFEALEMPKVAKPTCTCGASATGSKLHSPWCP